MRTGTSGSLTWSGSPEFGAWTEPQEFSTTGTSKSHSSHSSSSNSGSAAKAKAGGKKKKRDFGFEKLAAELEKEKQLRELGLVPEEEFEEQGLEQEQELGTDASSTAAAAAGEGSGGGEEVQLQVQEEDDDDDEEQEQERGRAASASGSVAGGGSKDSSRASTPGPPPPQQQQQQAQHPPPERKLSKKELAKQKKYQKKDAGNASDAAGAGPATVSFGGVSRGDSVGSNLSQAAVPSVPPRASSVSGSEAAESTSGGGAGGDGEPKAWFCSTCRHLNWPQRLTCKKCSVHRDKNAITLEVGERKTYAAARDAQAAAAAAPGKKKADGEFVSSVQPNPRLPQAIHEAAETSKSLGKVAVVEYAPADAPPPPPLFLTLFDPMERCYRTKWLAARGIDSDAGSTRELRKQLLQQAFADAPTDGKPSGSGGNQQQQGQRLNWQQAEAVEVQHVPKFKAACKFWSSGSCNKGNQCQFMHEGPGGCINRTYGRSPLPPPAAAAGGWNAAASAGGSGWGAEAEAAAAGAGDDDGWGATGEVGADWGASEGGGWGAVASEAAGGGTGASDGGWGSATSAQEASPAAAVAPAPAGPDADPPAVKHQQQQPPAAVSYVPGQAAGYQAFIQQQQQQHAVPPPPPPQVVPMPQTLPSMPYAVYYQQQPQPQPQPPVMMQQQVPVAGYVPQNMVAGGMPGMAGVPGVIPSVIPWWAQQK